MSSREFVFTIEFSSQGAPASLIEDLASQVFRHVGCSAETVPGLTEAFEQAVARTASGTHCRFDVQCRAHNGKLDILVSSNAGRVWQETLTIP